MPRTATIESIDASDAQGLQDYPVAFLRGFLPQVRLWSAMELVMERVWLRKRTSIRACHGISKTFTAACAGVTFLNTFPRSVVISTAPTHRQVENLLWKEIRTLYRVGQGVLAGECLTTRVKVAEDWFMYGFSSDRPVAMEGQHAPAILWIMDEAKGLGKEMYDAAEGSMTGGFSRMLEISTTDGAGQTCPLRIHHTGAAAEWDTIRLSAIDSPFIDPDDPDLKDYEKYRNTDLFWYGKPRHGPEWPLWLAREIQLADKEWILDRVRGWRSEPDTILTKVWGEFAEKDEDSVLPVAWVNKAVNQAGVKADPKRTVFGFDVAEGGADQDVLTERQGGLVFEQTAWPMADLMKCTGKVIALTQGRGPIQMDKIGVGAGPYWRLVELEQPVVGLESGGAPYFDPDAYANLRAEMWWHARQVFWRNYEEGRVLSIPDDPQLKEELTSVRYSRRSDGRILIESKKDVRKRLGRSPDKADSLVYCLARTPPPDQELPPEMAKLVLAG